MTYRHRISFFSSFVLAKQALNIHLQIIGRYIPRFKRNKVGVS